VRATHPSGVTAAAQEVFTSQHDGKTLTQFIYDIAPPGVWNRKPQPPDTQTTLLYIPVDGTQCL